MGNLVRHISHICIWFWLGTISFCQKTLWKSWMSYCTRSSTAEKLKVLQCMTNVFGANTVYRSIQPIDGIRFCISIMPAKPKSVLFEKMICKFVTQKLMQLVWNLRTVAMPFLFPVKHSPWLSMVWMISTQIPSCAALCNMYFDSICCIIIKI